MPPYAPQTWSPEELAERRRLARLRAYQPMLVVAGAFCAGVVLDRYASLGPGQLVLSAGVIAVWCVLWRRGRLAVAALALLVSVLLLAGAWHDCRWRNFSGDDLGRFAHRVAKPVCFEAVALESPGRRAAPERSPYRAIPGAESSTLEVRVVALRDAQRWRSAHGRCRVITDGHLLGVRGGDRVRVYGQLVAPIGAMNPGEFDFALDQRARGRLCQVRCESPDCVQVVRQGRAGDSRSVVDGVRVWGEQTLLHRLGPDAGALAAAMIVGAQDRLPRATIESFRRSGALHVLVVSGLHVGLVISVFYFIARMGWVPRRWSLVVIMLAIAAYAWVTGARPPVVRAAVLAELMCVALWQGRTVLAMNSLGAAAIVVLAINPCELFRTGAQLSFLAAATLITFGRWHVERAVHLDPMTRLLRSVEPISFKAMRWLGGWALSLMLATAAVWIVAAPLMLYRYHLLAPVAIPMAAAVFPLVACSVVGGLLLLVAEFALPPVAPLFADVSRMSCGLLDSTATWTESFHRYEAGPPLWWVLCFYVLIALACKWVLCPGRRRVLLYAGLALCAVGFGTAAAARLGQRSKPQALECTFISVGHGVSVLMQSPNGGAFLYDCGSLGSPWIATERISSVLWSRGVRRLDGVFLSHADVDHFNGLPGLLERFEVRGVYTTMQMFPRTLLPDERTAPAELKRLLALRGVPIHTLALGDRVQLGGATAEVLFPTPLGFLESDNANSLVLGIEHAGSRVLLPGDLEGRGLEEVVMQEPYDCDVLLAPHHGSPRSDPPGFANWCRPEHVVISAAEGVYSDDAKLGYQRGGAQVMSTARHGAVTFTLGEEGLSVDTFRHSSPAMQKEVP